MDGLRHGMVTELAGTEGVAHRLLGCLHTVIGLGLDILFAGVWSDAFLPSLSWVYPALMEALELSRAVIFGDFRPWTV